jgi:hypothetical protein
MSNSNETATAILLAGFLHGSEASIGMEWLDSVEGGLSNTSLHCLVVSSSTLGAAKTHDMYGHFDTKTQIKLTPVCYWKDNNPTGGLTLIYLMLPALLLNPL